MEGTSRRRREGGRKKVKTTGFRIRKLFRHGVKAIRFSTIHQLVNPYSLLSDQIRLMRKTNKVTVTLMFFVRKCLEIICLQVKILFSTLL